MENNKNAKEDDDDEECIVHDDEENHKYLGPSINLIGALKKPGLVVQESVANSKMRRLSYKTQVSAPLPKDEATIVKDGIVPSAVVQPAKSKKSGVHHYRSLNANGRSKSYFRDPGGASAVALHVIRESKGEDHNESHDYKVKTPNAAGNAVASSGAANMNTARRRWTKVKNFFKTVRGFQEQDTKKLEAAVSQDNELLTVIE